MALSNLWNSATSFTSKMAFETLPHAANQANDWMTSHMQPLADGLEQDNHNGEPGLRTQAKLAALGRQKAAKADLAGQQHRGLNKEEAVAAGMGELNSRQGPQVKAVLRASLGYRDGHDTAEQRHRQEAVDQFVESGPANLNLVYSLRDVMKARSGP